LTPTDTTACPDLGGDAPTETASTVRVTLDREVVQWLVSEFDPI
jgi:hypothetical protein